MISEHMWTLTGNETAFWRRKTNYFTGISNIVSDVDQWPGVIWVKYIHMYSYEVKDRRK